MTARRLLALIACATAAALAGCVGDTGPPEHVTATKMTLHAHGHTNNGPARWWWEYGIGRATVTGGGGTKTPKRGPASSATDVDLSETVSGLDPDQTYFFRACGQDTAAGSPVTCGRLRESPTAPADSTVTLDASHNTLRFSGGAGTRHRLDLFDNGNQRLQVVDDVKLPQTDPPTGSAITSGSGCVSGLFGSNAFYDQAFCTGAIVLFVGTLGPLDDTASLRFVTSTRGELHGGGGADSLTGTEQPDALYGDAGDDTLDGSAGQDFMDGGPGLDTYKCGESDTVVTDSTAERNAALAAGCSVIS